MAEIFRGKTTKKCRKQCKNAHFEKPTALYFKCVKCVLKFKISGKSLMTEEIVNQHIILEFLYEKNTQKMTQKLEKKNTIFFGIRIVFMSKCHGPRCQNG